MTLWFPIRLMHTIRQSLPQVDPYTELGRKRSRPEMELEYQRLLERDQSPFGFLYKGTSVHSWVCKFNTIEKISEGRGAPTNQSICGPNYRHYLLWP
jgi:hypothetical protein